ncbi:MAG: tryptophan synthase subunit alpha [Flavobacteriaceae bacterium]|tara:strand:+ start:1954 stop:2721 length:768 start_codon:yes stop_codon:yes gene_type:complete
MNRIDKIFLRKEKLISIYFTAGYPNLNDTIPIIKKLQKAGVDMVEIGLPFSDPLADGPTIQESSKIALNNGMTSEKLFNQLKNIRKEIDIPLVIMGYFNPILQYGVNNFCESASRTGVDGLIIPDLPVDVYHDKYQNIFEKYNLYNMFLITPQTSENRIKFIDKISKGFIYMVSNSSITGAKGSIKKSQIKYFKKISSLNLKTPQLIGFGISNFETYNNASMYSRGAIIGSAFIEFIKNEGINNIEKFIKKIISK